MVTKNTANIKELEGRVFKFLDVGVKELGAPEMLAPFSVREILDWMKGDGIINDTERKELERVWQSKVGDLGNCHFEKSAKDSTGGNVWVLVKGGSVSMQSIDWSDLEKL